MSFSQLLLVSLLGGAVVFAVWNLRRRQHAWTAFAQRHGWASTGTLSRLEVRRPTGRSLSAFTVRDADGDTATRTVVRLDVSDVLPRELTLRSDEVKKGLLVWLGIRDDELGGDAVAQVLDRQRLTPRALSVLRTPSVREHLLALRDPDTFCALADGTLELTWLSVPGTADELEVLLAPALDLGEALDTASARPTERARTSG